MNQQRLDGLYPKWAQEQAQGLTLEELQEKVMISALIIDELRGEVEHYKSLNS
jgi:hypothetical protein